MVAALLLVDIQNDFLPGGALAVAEGDEVVAVANKLMPAFKQVIATQDWHPAGHGSFASSHAGKRVGEVIKLNGLRQILWPEHCVQGTSGAELAPGLDRTRITHVVRKGTDAGIDSYSAFFDNGHKKRTGLHEYLQAQGIRELCVMGLATDYCVKFTALDARTLGYAVELEVNGCRGVNLKGGDVNAAVAEMVGAGVGVVEARK